MSVVASFLQLAGLAVISVAATMWSPVLGVLVVGVALFAVGLAVER